MSSVHRTIQVLDLLARRGPLGVRVVSSSLGLPVGSVHRLLNDLADEQVVEREIDGAWRLSYRLLGIVDLQLEAVGFHKLARPFCEALAEEFGETVNLNAVSAQGSVCIDKVRGNEHMQLDWRVGSHSPYHCGGSAKAILAFASEVERRRILALPRTRFTPNTILSEADLLNELEQIRERGYAIDNQEIVVGVYCVAVPILDRKGASVGAISISGPSPKAPGKQILPMVARLNDACMQVSRRLGFAEAWPPITQQSAV